jgi:lysophospholipase L1-like esterase
MRFVAFGDSITYGTFSSFDAAFLYDSPAHSYPARAQLSLRQTFPLQAAAMTVVNAGVPGESAVQGRNRIASVLTTYDPDGLLLLEGINDMNFGASPTATAAAVVAIVDVARTYNVTVLLGLMPQTYASVYPNGQERSQSADLIVPFNNELRRLTAGMQNVHVVDLYSAFGTNRSLMGADGLHPTDAGYELMAAKFVQAIESVFRVRGSLQ